MSAIPNDGGSAFPFGQISELTGQPINGFFDPGMTLRDWFAGQETLSDYDHPEAWKAYHIAMEVVNGPHPDPGTDPLGYHKWECEARAKVKLTRADAMLAARKTPTGGQE